MHWGRLQEIVVPALSCSQSADGTEWHVLELGQSASPNLEGKICFLLALLTELNAL